MFHHPAGVPARPSAILCHVIADMKDTAAGFAAEHATISCQITL